MADAEVREQEPEARGWMPNDDEELALVESSVAADGEGVCMSRRQDVEVTLPG